MHSQLLPALLPSTAALLRKTDEKITQLLRDEMTSIRFSLGAPFPRLLYRQLLRYRELLYKRTFNPSYPDPSLPADALVHQLTRLLAQ